MGKKRILRPTAVSVNLPLSPTSTLGSGVSLQACQLDPLWPAALKKAPHMVKIKWNSNRSERHDSFAGYWQKLQSLDNCLPLKELTYCELSLGNPVLSLSGNLSIVLNLLWSLDPRKYWLGNFARYQYRWNIISIRFGHIEEPETPRDLLLIFLSVKMTLLLPWPNSKAVPPNLPGASVGLIDWILSEPVRFISSSFAQPVWIKVATCWEERVAEVGRRVKLARTNLTSLLYQGEEEARVLGVLEVQQEARLIERLWEGVGQPLPGDTIEEGEGAAQVDWCRMVIYEMEPRKGYFPVPTYL